jgi:dimeric dUTPase (all-alpha-NTP-PPase superfamily)
MNVEDVTFGNTQIAISEIFEKQEALFEKYHEIEGKRGIGLGLLKTLHGDIDDAVRQYVIKDCAWRTVEEIAEAMEAYEGNPNEISIAHVHEELIDSLHFFVELFQIAGISFAQVEEEIGLVQAYFEENSLDPQSVAISRFVKHLGMAMNCLKMKPWKQSQVLTGKGKFTTLICESFVSWIRMVRSFGLTAEGMCEMYYKKNQVNQFRQRSNY